VLVELAILFGKLGLTAFGGPAAHTAMMRDEVVDRRKWLTSEEFLDLVGATNLIPGPNSTELAIHIGHRRGGWPGLVVAGACFILPAALGTAGLAWLYVRYGQFPRAGALLGGIKPVIVAIIVQALWSLGKTALKSWTLRLLGIASVVAAALGLHELVVLFGAAVIAALPALRGAKGDGSSIARSVFWLGAPPALASASAASVPGLFFVFLKIGSVLFGSGYVLVAFLRSELVERLHWLTEAQLIDAVAAGQVTPGPVFTTATFLGYLLGGGPGALAATLGIFLPAFFFVAVSSPLVPKLRGSRVAGAFLDGLNVASLALMCLVSWQLARASLAGPIPLLLAGGSLFTLVRFKINATWLIAAGALVGLARG
jgi:chromate transporter